MIFIEGRLSSLGARLSALSLKAIKNQHSTTNTQKSPLFERGLSSSVDLNVGSIPDQPIAGAWRATGVDSAAARSRGKL
jgi:hypothetical protein